MQYKIWNKKDEINNADADYIINSLNIKKDDEVFLIFDDSSIVLNVEIVRIIKMVYELDDNLTVDEVAQEYIRIMEQQKETEISSTNDPMARISALENSINEIMVIFDQEVNK